MHTLLTAGGFHLVYVDGDHSRTLVADVSATGDAAGFLVGSERFPFTASPGWSPPAHQRRPLDGA